MSLDVITLAKINGLKKGGGVGYVETKTKPLTIEWDGVIGERETVDTGIFLYVKLSEATPTYEEISKGTIRTCEVYKDWKLYLQDLRGQGLPCVICGDTNNPFLIFAQDVFEFNGIKIEKGIYSVCSEFAYGLLYFEYIHLPSYTTGELKTIDPKFLPSGGEASEKMFVFELTDLKCSELGGHTTQFETMLAVTLQAPNQYHEFQVTGDFTKVDGWATTDELKLSPLYITDHRYFVPATFVSTGDDSERFNGEYLDAFACGALVVKDGAMIETKMFFQRTYLDGGTIYTKADVLNL